MAQKQLSNRNFVEAIDFLLNGMTTDQLTQLLDDIAHYTKAHQDSTNPLVRERLPGLKFVSTLTKATIETRIIPHDD